MFGCGCRWKLLYLKWNQILGGGAYIKIYSILILNHWRWPDTISEFLAKLANFGMQSSQIYQVKTWQKKAYNLPFMWWWPETFVFHQRARPQGDCTPWLIKDELLEPYALGQVSAAGLLWWPNGYAGPVPAGRKPSSGSAAWSWNFFHWQLNEY